MLPPVLQLAAQLAAQPEPDMPNLTPEEIQELVKSGALSPETATMLAPKPAVAAFDEAARAHMGERDSDRFIGFDALLNPAPRGGGQAAPPQRRQQGGGVSEIEALKAKVAQRNQEREQRIAEAMVGSNVLASTEGLVPAARLPEQFRQMRGPAGERVVGLDPRRLSAEDLVSIGFSPDEAAQISTPPQPPVTDELERKRILAALAMGRRNGR